MLNGLGWPHLLILAAIVILFFGAKRLPDAARGMGRAMRIFRSETQGMREDIASEKGQATPPQAAAPQQLPPAQPYVAPAPPAAPTAPTSVEQPAPVQDAQPH